MSLSPGLEVRDPRPALGEIDYTGGAHERADFDEPGQRSERASQRITALGEMTGGIAHDFRNVLALIESSLHLAERDLGDLEKLRFCLVAAHDGVGRGLKLTSRLLAFTKQQELESHAENANDLLRNLEMFLQFSAGPGFRLRFDLAPDLPNCLIDPSQFNAAILNLVVNARDAMPGGGLIKIGTRIVTAVNGTGATAPGSCVRVRVRDQGLGMPPPVVGRIFDPYFTTKGETGTGLGLPQVYASMKLVGGRVSVASEVGVGTTFDLLFPALEDQGPAGRLSAQICHCANEGGAAEQESRPVERMSLPTSRTRKVQ